MLTCNDMGSCCAHHHGHEVAEDPSLHLHVQAQQAAEQLVDVGAGLLLLLLARCEGVVVLALQVLQAPDRHQRLVSIAQVLLQGRN